MIRNSLLTPRFVPRHIARVHVSIWSPLAEAFNTLPSPKYQIKSKNVGLFGVPELTTAKGFFDIKQDCVLKTNGLISEALSNWRARKMVEIFDEISDTLCKVADLAEFIRSSHPHEEYSYAAQVACATVSGIVEKLNTNIELYEVLKNAVRQGDVVKTTDVDNHVGELFLFDFEQCGIHLPEETRNKVVQLNDSILTLGQQFVSGTATPRVIKKDLLPPNVGNFFMTDSDKVVISSLYTDSNSPLAREMAYKIFLHPDPNQEQILSHLLQSRDELGKLCGFNSYSERALKGSTIDTPDSVKEFLDKLNSEIWDMAQNDFDCMEKLKQTECMGVGPLASWDVPYFTQSAKKNWFRVSSKEYSPYFSLGACMDGLNMLFQSLYGIQLVNSDVEPGECWYTDVYKLAVVHETEGLLGYIYCDLYERTGKSNQDCHFTIRGGRQLRDGSYQLPIVVLMLNLPAPRWSSPSLLTPNMVDNLFHEMGHAMHSMLGRTQYQHVTGTRCSTDFAEVPSILMEYFASDIRVLKRFARHFQTKQPMTDDMLHRLCASKHLFISSETQLQIFYAAIDQVYHGKHPLSGSTTDVLATTQRNYYGLPYVPNTAWQLRFSHLVVYGAKYYSYLVSRAVAYLIWKTYFEKDPFSRENGERYRRECLGFGGGKHPKKLVEDFLKVDPSASVFAKALYHEIEHHQGQVDLVIKNK
ncbi:mitochondrial intermediate peptidase [Sitophilus oryzae]|uniref:Mitochondrial intermediate peptidase n=1 Tax=Sitophilus oryzae TaxID=7048 RepID=A0A6J2YBF0_SITOR|nr:mitochondrial intermediate peptidase [Sitophilus oryzae]